MNVILNAIILTNPECLLMKSNNSIAFNLPTCCCMVLVKSQLIEDICDSDLYCTVGTVGTVFLLWDGPDGQ